MPSECRPGDGGPDSWGRARTWAIGEQPTPLSRYLPFANMYPGLAQAEQSTALKQLLGDQERLGVLFAYLCEPKMPAFLIKP